MSAFWQTIILNPIFNVLAVLYNWTSDLGLSIILFTIVLRLILVPLTLPQIKMSKKQRDIQPELEKIKEKFKYDKRKQAEMQMELFKKHGINPGAGCLTTIVTLALMVAIYRAVSMFTVNPDISILNSHIYWESFKLPIEIPINTKFLYLNLAKPDPYLVVTLMAVGLQFLATKMVMPYSEIEEKAAEKTPEKTDDMMAAFQKQNLYMMPIMFFVFGLTLPSGVMLYIITTTIFQIIQTYLSSGWGGLKGWINKIKFVKKTL